MRLLPETRKFDQAPPLDRRWIDWSAMRKVLTDPHIGPVVIAAQIRSRIAQPAQNRHRAGSPLEPRSHALVGSFRLRLHLFQKLNDEEAALCTASLAHSLAQLKVKRRQRH